MLTYPRSFWETSMPTLETKRCSIYFLRTIWNRLHPLNRVFTVTCTRLVFSCERSSWNKISTTKTEVLCLCRNPGQCTLNIAVIHSTWRSSNILRWNSRVMEDRTRRSIGEANIDSITWPSSFHVHKAGAFKHSKAVSF